MITTVRPAAPGRLVDRRPQPRPAHLVDELVPPARFADVSFATYNPDPSYPSQAAALARLQSLAADLAAPSRRMRFGRRAPQPPRAVYLDGGFGVGKTHLLASLWFATPVRKVYAPFAEVVAFVGALSMTHAVEALRGVRLVCIDEFELDDPGNTHLVATLLRALIDAGASVAATSNTLPSQLGEGRFDAERFQREIGALAALFDVVTIDGEDYRHRDVLDVPAPWSTADVVAAAQRLGPRATLDDAAALVAHLREVHPVRYRALIDGVHLVAVTGVRPVEHLADALRVARLVDVLYDEEIPLALAGCPLDALIPEALHGGAYRKVFGRCRSRLVALTGEAERARAA